MSEENLARQEAAKSILSDARTNVKHAAVSNLGMCVAASLEFVSVVEMHPLGMLGGLAMGGASFWFYRSSRRAAEAGLLEADLLLSTDVPSETPPAGIHSPPRAPPTNERHPGAHLLQ
jgi:hypothetical protein